MNELENQRQQEKRRVDTEQMIKEAELGLLRQKLQPHFLFNSLNSISALAISQPDEARNMIHQLSDFLRGTMKKDDQEFVKFDEEIKHLQLYLEIEKVRFGHRLIVDMNIASEALSKMVPPLIMQPIVENAIKFGLYGTLEETMIKIEANLEGSYLVIKTENPFDADSQGNSSGTGFGLTSIQRRLFLLFARQDLLKTDKKEKSFTTILRIPQKS
ncbi:MAG: histidine kinase [Flavobacteriales bacterium]|nr:histidine kinase [Flavobacteriales bacterium]